MILPLILLYAWGCAPVSLPGKRSEAPFSRYGSEIRSNLLSDQLQQAMHAIRKVNCYVSYRTYVFGENSRITSGLIQSDSVFTQVSASLVNNEATSGTALVISNKDHHLVLLTCAHVVDLPDTIFQYSGYSNLEGDRYIYSISVKLRETIAVRDIPQGNRFLVLASDKESDLAIIGRQEQPDATPAGIFPYKCGDPALLEWGNTVYLLGFPSGQMMATKGLVSLSADPDSYFLTDAPFNEGFSGGAAVVFNGLTGKFELLGLGRSVSSHAEYILKPEKDIHENVYNQAIPYLGQVFVKQKKDINYGITYVTSVSKAISMYVAHRQLLVQKGYNLDDFFLTEKP